MSWNHSSYTSSDIIAVNWPEHIASRSVKKNVYQCSAGKLGKVSRYDLEECLTIILTWILEKEIVNPGVSISVTTTSV